ncbi:ULK/ULK protein kinase [Spizellomyces punctatus DAOM BR117]|uniref:non-specific serine/threonine protein kinase n=1 Tax=Spizellomyces punctatus (strain DAOM BR117) TaxID=645134 RepID=A0A0L0HT94_SPIPD|nr:ULK/ULK protein kinase [Spizellomyces punctatus DAOM BR117]KND04327.1 ULK/ULK protein kinase [Spizellomyces punctatus DAOM BR117]|eukprot:XP_016612366.1 ULK/ULK protein kinase [Spizellomyces punctatus DAOM BR117]
MASPPSYITISKLGEGTSGIVYRCRPKSGGADVAIKVIPRSQLGRSRKQEKVVQEIAILKRLRHQNIVRFVDLEWDTHNVFIVMELCELGNLKEFLARKHGRRLVERDARWFLRQIAAGLFFLWSHSLVHRDLKTENLLLTANPNSHGQPILKIADFGIADYGRNQDFSSAAMKEKIGTLAYMAPEVLKDEEYDARCDLWSVGVIFYEMLAGSTPFHTASSIDDLLKQILSPTPSQLILPPTIARTTSQTAQSLVSALLTRDPNKRLTFDEYFDHPYLDLTHIPGSESLSSGMEYISEAVELDNRFVRSKNPSGRKELKAWKQIIDLYAEGVAHLLAHVQYLGPQNPDAVQVAELVTRYINRAESLKHQVETWQNSPGTAGERRRSSGDQDRLSAPPFSVKAGPISSSLARTDFLSSPSTPSSANAQVQAALDVLNTAQSLAATNPNHALQVYDTGLAQLLRAIAMTCSPVERDKIRSEACEWFDQAERLGQAVKRQQETKGWQVVGGGIVRKGGMIDIVYNMPGEYPS